MFYYLLVGTSERLPCGIEWDEPGTVYTPQADGIGLLDWLPTVVLFLEMHTVRT